jgi:hypothetical protein
VAAVRFSLRRLGISLDAGLLEVARFQSESFDSCLRKPAPRFDLLIRSHHCTDNCLGLHWILFRHKVDRADGRTAPPSVRLSPIRPDHLPYLNIPLIALPRPPRSPDRTRSPVAVSRKREYFKYPSETIGDFAPAGPNFGTRRPIANSQKPAIGGHF